VKLKTKALAIPLHSLCGWFQYITPLEIINLTHIRVKPQALAKPNRKSKQV